jgi:hypothetical protein
VRERVITLLCALGALAVFITLFIRTAPLETPAGAPPTTLERGASGLLAARTWLAGEGIRTLSLQVRFDALVHRHDLPPSGNLLIVSTPAVTAFRTDEVRALQTWLRGGNTLLVLAALSDRPAWSLNGAVHNDLNLLTGLEFVRTRVQPGSAGWPRAWSGVPQGRAAPGRHGVLRLAQPLTSTLVANRPHPYLSGIHSAVAISDFLPETWDIRLPRAGFALALARQREMGQGVLWLRPVGNGTVIVSAFGSLFSNRTIGQADNARLLANLVTASLGPHGAVLFDDEHQGLVAAYDPAKFYRDPRLYQTLGVLLAVWFVWVLGGTRLRIPENTTPAPREVDLVRTTGAFLARVLKPAAAARRLFEHFFTRLRRATHAGATQELPWEWLEHHPRLAAADVRQLRAWYADAYSDRRVPLLRLYNLMVNTERRLAA